MKALDGPRLPARQGPATSLVVLLHGYGADGNDLIALGEVWSGRLQRTAFVSPHAPDPLPGMALGGRQWFPLTFRNADELREGTLAAAPALTAFIGAELERLKLQPSQLALVGFSQGSMMALHVAARLATPVACVVGYSGLLAGPEHLAAETLSRPPVLLIHGSEDEVIPAQALHGAREGLAAAGFPVEWHLVPGLGHGIDEQGLAWGASFLAAYLPR